MIEAIDRIARYATRGRDAFDRDELIQSWFIRHLQIIGEAARALPDEVRLRSPDIEWKKITGMRHVLAAKALLKTTAMYTVMYETPSDDSETGLYRTAS